MNGPKRKVIPPHRTMVFFGKHRGETLEQIGSTAEGLRYLDWMYRKAVIRQAGLEDAIGCYLNHPAVAPTLNALLRP